MSELASLIETIKDLDTAAWPVQEMEKIVSSGPRAAGPVIACLKEGEAVDELPFIVLLGLLGTPETVPVLAEYMKDIRKSAEAAAAAESLARIGLAAFAVLQETVEHEASVPARILAYGSLGYTQLPEAYELLSRRFDTDTEAVDGIGMALALYGKKEDVVRLYAKYVSLAPGIVRRNLEDAVHCCAHPEALSGYSLKENWRVRYRRLPELDHFPVPSPFELIAVSHADCAPVEKDESAAEGIKQLSDITHHQQTGCHDPSSLGGSRDEEPMENRTGVAVCFEDLPMLITFQKTMVDAYMRQGCSTVQQAYDLLDTFFEQLTAEKDEERRNQQEEMYSIGCATVDYILRRGIHELSQGLEKLDDIGRLVGEEYKSRFGRYPDVTALSDY